MTNPPSTEEHHNWVRSAVAIGGFVVLAVILIVLCRYFPPLQA